MQKNEDSVADAVAQAEDHVARLHGLSLAQRERHRLLDQPATERHWEPGAGTYCYQTHIAIGGQPAQRLDWLAEVLFAAPELVAHPWYPQFKGGMSMPVEVAPVPGIEAQRLCWGEFDLGVGAPRYYRQLVAMARPDSQTVVLAARSVATGPALPPAVQLAYTLSPNGEVLHFADGCIHWHHICCTPGAAVLPGRLDRWFINALRLLRLDTAERSTYRSEAEQMRDWLQSGAELDAGLQRRVGAICTSD